MFSAFNALLMANVETIFLDCPENCLNILVNTSESWGSLNAQANEQWFTNPCTQQPYVSDILLS